MTIFGVTPTTQSQLSVLFYSADCRRAAELCDTDRRSTDAPSVSRLATRYQLPVTSFVVLLSALTFQVSSISSWAQTKSTPKPDPFAKLAKELAEEAPGEEVNIGVGNFAYENTDLLSPFSSMLGSLRLFILHFEDRVVRSLS